MSRLRRGRATTCARNAEPDPANQGPILFVSRRPARSVDSKSRGRAGVGLKRTNASGKATRFQPIIGADPAKQRPSRRVEHAPHVLVQTDVGLIDIYPETPVGTRIFLEHSDCSVIRGAIADDEFEIGEVLREDRFDAASNKLPTISDGKSN